ncbi:MAG: rhodanese-like domain-containing protein [Desulfuromonadaceae bacterium]
MRKNLLLMLLPVALLALFPSFSPAENYGIIQHAELKQLLDADLHPFLLVDSRNPEEYREAHIPGAISIPQKAFDELIGLLPADSATMLIFYCNGVKCGKSKKSAEAARELGYTNVRVFAEGMPVWEEVGYTFYKGEDYEKRIETTLISPVDLQELAETQPAGLQIVDVRDAEEFAAGHIPGAINCPLNSFAASSEILDKDKKIVVYCNSGGRSYSAYCKLLKLGYKNIAQAIFADWKEAGLPVAL